MSTDTAISGTSISVATDRISSQRVFYQLLNGRIDERGNLDGIWSNSHLNDVSPVSASPLASVIYYRKGNQEVSRVPAFPVRGPDLHADRFACITSTPNTLSESWPTPTAKAGVEGRLTE